MEILGSIGGRTFLRGAHVRPWPESALHGSSERFHERATEALRTFEAATSVPARLILMGDLRQLPPALRETCRMSRAMSDSAIRCLRWHGAMRESASQSDGLSRAVCDRGLMSAAVALRARGETVGLVEFGPLPQTSCASCEAALVLSGPLVRDLEREACAVLDRASHALPEPVRKAIDFIDRNFATPLSLAAAAQAASLSPGHFSRIFRAGTGQSLAGYLAAVRVRRACELLSARPHARISEIAMDCGFESIPHFNRQFRKITGTSPGRFRAGQAPVL